jgi:hypothetical protein
MTTAFFCFAATATVGSGLLLVLYSVRSDLVERILAPAWLIRRVPRAEIRHG